ncbi:hypothetical protein GW17_00007537 [Ensete ventricosum]|nr:hypothetical protein GW17_00007537 [Ensete ventricosum]RZS16078.1 hypothetical protein BHM03_00048026 [Ensete ventricosum]
MPAIKRLYEVCKRSFSDNGPLSAEALEHVRSVLGEFSNFFLLTSLFAFVTELEFLCTAIVLPISSFSDDIKPSDVGLEDEAQKARGWNVSMHGSNGRKGRNGNNQYLPPIKYLHIYECESFSVSI